MGINLPERCLWAVRKDRVYGSRHIAFFPSRRAAEEYVYAKMGTLGTFRVVEDWCTVYYTDCTYEDR